MAEYKITPTDVKASLNALEEKLKIAFPYSYGYDGTPEYLFRDISEVNRGLLKLIRRVQKIKIHCPGKFYKKRSAKIDA